MEEKWKLSKKETTTSSSSKSKFSRSFSTSASSAKSPLFARSSSTKCSVPSSSSSISRSLSRKERKSSSSPSSSITQKYSSLAKEQKARFYIMRRAEIMNLEADSRYMLKWRNQRSRYVSRRAEEGWRRCCLEEVLKRSIPNNFAFIITVISLIKT